MIYDIVTYNGEASIFDIRYNILKDHVDRFIVVESPTTFAGKQKPLFFEEIIDNYEDKIAYLVVDFGANWELLSRSIKSELTNGLESYARAYYQKDAARWAIGFEDEDIIYYGDIDEIWTPQNCDDRGYKLEQLVYSGYLNQRSDEKWTGTLVTKAKHVKEYGLNELRHYTKLTKPNGGWHFTFQGGAKEIKRKLESYDHQEFNTDEIKDTIEYNLIHGKDFLAREHKHWISQEEWPQYLKDNAFKYKDLLKYE